MNELTCRDLIEFLGEYFDGTLPAAQRATFDEHLALCRACRDFLASYRATVELERAALDWSGPSGADGPDRAAGPRPAPAPPPLPESLVKAIMAARRRGSG